MIIGRVVASAARRWKMLGLIIKVVLGLVVVGAGAAVVLTVVPTPDTCTPAVSVPATTDARARWDAYAAKRPPAHVTFTEADASAVLRQELAGKDLPITDTVVHFCADGTAQLAFAVPVGPIVVKGVATGRVEASSPLTVSVTSIRVGGLPSAVTEPVVGAIRDVAAKASSLGLAGPVKEVAVSEGKVRISQ